MKKPIFLLLHLLLLLFSSIQAQVVDTVLIRQFSYSDYNAGITNYSGVTGKDGTIFFSNSDGVLIYDGAGWELVRIEDTAEVTSLLFDNDTLYVGANDEFGYLLQDRNSRWRYSSLTHLYPDSEKVDDVWQIIRTEYGIYFESYYTILLYDGTTISEIDIPDSYVFAVEGYLLASSFYGDLKLVKKDAIVDSLYIQELTDDAAFGVLSLNEGEHLFFTAEHGAFVLSLNPLKLEPWEVPVNEMLKNDGFYHGVEYQDSLIIFTTWDKGVILFNKQGELIKQIDIASGLPDKSLLELFVDDNDNIWIPSRSGIYQMRLSLDKISGNFKPRTLIKNITTEQGTVKDLNDIYDPAYLVFEYTTPGLNKEDLEYSFLLEGYDNEWTIWSNQYQKEYNSLANGNYTFNVKARVKGHPNESEASSVSFHVNSPWYKLTISYIVAAFIVILIVVLILRIRARELNKSKIELERVVVERTKELIDEREKLKILNDELVTANTELDNFVYRSSHDLVAPLKSLRGLMAITRLDTKDPQMLEYVSMMEKSALKLEKFINSIMEYSINAKSASDHKLIELNEIIDEIDQDIKFFDKYSAITITRDLDEHQFYSDPKRVKIVLSNLITNAIKYHNIDQEKPWIKISSRIQDGGYSIDVEDNGRGIREDLINKIFDMFYRASESSEGSGLGLYIVKDTMKKLEGEISVVSTLSQGSTFTLKFSS